MARSQGSWRRRSAPLAGGLGDLQDYARQPTRKVRRSRKAPAIDWTVTDDWPEDMPVTEAEVDVFEAWFGDLFDALLSTGD
jgi:hypothetical protein